MMESLKNNPLYSEYLLFNIIRDISYSGSVQIILPYVISKIHCSAKITNLLAINIRQMTDGKYHMEN